MPKEEIRLTRFICHLFYTEHLTVCSPRIILFYSPPLLSMLTCCPSSRLSLLFSVCLSVRTRDFFLRGAWQRLYSGYLFFSTMYQRKVDMYMLNAVKSVLAFLTFCACAVFLAVCLSLFCPICVCLRLFLWLVLVLLPILAISVHSTSSVEQHISHVTCALGKLRRRQIKNDRLNYWLTGSQISEKQLIN